MHMKSINQIIFQPDDMLLCDKSIDLIGVDLLWNSTVISTIDFKLNVTKSVNEKEKKAIKTWLRQ